MGQFAGRSIGDATLDGLEDRDALSLRLRPRQCSDPVFAVPLLLTNVAIPDIADRAYRTNSGYRTVDVYKGRVLGEFSYFSRLIARSLLETYDAPAGYYVRFYAPANCEIRSKSFVQWADTILMLGSRAGRTPEA